MIKRYFKNRLNEMCVCGGKRKREKKRNEPEGIF